jgi:PAS domain S-box-containing protein
MSPLDRRRSIAVLVIAALVGVATLALGALGFENHRALRHHAQTDLRSELERTSNVLALSLELPLWNFDRLQVNDLLDGVMDNRDVLAVVVRQPDVSSARGVAVYARARDRNWAPVASTLDPAPRTAAAATAEPVQARDVVRGDNQLGTLTLVGTTRFMQQRLQSSLMRLLLEIAAVDLSLVLSLYLLLSRIVLTPLAEVEAFARDVSLGQRGGVPERRRREFHGELESLRASLERTFELLDTRYTRLRESEEMLRASEAKYRLLAEHVGDVIWVLGEDERLVYVSPSVEQLRGFRPEVVLTQTLEQMLTPDSLARLRRYLAEPPRKAGDAPALLELVQTRAAGDTVGVEVTLLPMFDERGERAGVLGCARDISERRRAARQREELEQQVRHAQKLEAIGTLAGGIAHDFNNILAAILSYSEMLLLDLDAESRLKKDVLGIQAAVQRASALVRQILAFSRQTPHEVKAVELSAVVAEALEMLRATLPATTTLRVRIGAAPRVLADPTEMHQVVVNLCTNAWKALPGGAGVVQVSLEAVTLDEDACTRLHGLLPGPHARLTVADDGAGMPAAVLERIFDPFFTTRVEGGGTGLGLAVVHGIVTRSKGAIAVTSELGRGSTFSVFLPLAAAAPAERAPAEELALPGTERVLYVDDERELTETMQRKLGRLGYRVSTLNSGPGAYGVLRASPEAYDLVITDLTMPDLRGDQLARLVRELRPDLPIVICTGSQQDIEPAWVERLGRAALLAKPVALPALTRLIRRLLDGGPLD